MRGDAVVRILSNSKQRPHPQTPNSRPLVVGRTVADMKISDYDGRVKAAYEAYLSACFKSELEQEQLRRAYFDSLKACEEKVPQ